MVRYTYFTLRIYYIYATNPYPRRVTPDFSIYEVGPRDGLQNLPHAVSIDDRVEMVRLLAGAGLRDIEVGSFVNPKRVPAMANTAQVFQQCADIDRRRVGRV